MCLAGSGERGCTPSTAFTVSRNARGLLPQGRVVPLDRLRGSSVCKMTKQAHNRDSARRSLHSNAVYLKVV